MRELIGAAFVAVLATSASADVELVVAPGDKITGTLDPTSEIERFLAPLPAGASLTVKAKSAKGGPQLRLRVYAPGDAQRAEEVGPKPVVSKLAIDTTGVHAIEVRSIGELTGDYALSVAWTVPKSVTGSASLGANGTGEFVFAAPAGVTASFAVKAARGSAAVAELVEVAGDGGSLQPLGPGATGRTVLPALDTYRLRLRETAGVAGDVSIAVKFAVPKTAKRKIDLSSRTVSPGTRIVAAALVGPAGGTLASPGGATAGASATFPPGAVKKKPVLATLGEGAPIVAADEEFEVAAGPTVFLGPEGAQWLGGGVRVTLPYDDAIVGDGDADLRVLTRDAEGATSPVTGVTVDDVAHTVSFDTPHFSDFQVVVTAAKRATLVKRLFYDTPGTSDFFGGSVAITDAWIAIGGEAIDSNGQSDSGAVFVYPFVDGVVGAPERIQAPTPERNDHFGAGVAIEGDVLVVGATGQFSQAQTPGGSAFVYRRSGNQWMLEQELASGTPKAGGSFGIRLAMDGPRIVIAAWNETNGAFSGAGAAYVFEYNGATWVRANRLLSSTPAAGDVFGRAVAIHGTTVAVTSSDNREDDEETFGDVTVFARDSGSGLWLETDNQNSRPSERLGSGVALGDGLLVVGAASANPPDGEGKAFAYAGAPGTFALEDTLKGTGPLNFRFGWSCAIDGDRMLVGAAGLGPEEAAGKAYSYERTNGAWKREATMRGADVGLLSGDIDNLVQGQFGWMVALNGTYFLVGAPSAPGGPNATRSGSGAAFLFQLDE